MILIAIIYFIAIFVFAQVYYHFYQKDRKNFSFNSDILSSQRELIKIQVDTEERELNTRLFYLRKLLADLKSKSVTPVNIVEPKPLVNVRSTITGHDYAFSLHSIGDEAAGIGSWMKLTIKENPLLESYDFRVSTDTSFIGTKTTEDWISLSNFLIQTTEKNLTPIQNRQTTFGQTQPDVWGFWDFVYFSAITQTTVGYGDILPNSRLVRIIVLVQIAFSIIIIVFVVNIITSRR
jgi:hypothetical protein